MIKARLGLGVVLSTLLVVASAYPGWSDRLPPDSVLKHARRVTGLPIPSEAVIENSEDPNGLIPTSYFNATFRFTPMQLQAIERKAEEKGYRRMPVTLKDAGAHPLLAPQSGSTSAGWYLLESHGDTYRVVILDARQLTLY